MTYAVQVERGGRVQIPDEVLSDLHLDEGDIVRLTQSENEGEVALALSESAGGGLIDEDGLLVWTSPGPYTPGLDRQVVLAIRRERDLRTLGTYAQTLD